jgi:hypothetical protein
MQLVVMQYVDMGGIGTQTVFGDNQFEVGVVLTELEDQALGRIALTIIFLRAVVFAVLMMLAFCVDQVQQLCCPLFQAVWAKLGSKRRLWERMRALFYDYALASMRHLFEALWYGWQKTAPILVDSS